MSRPALVWLALAGLVLPSGARAISVGPFGPQGEGGLVNGQVFEIGPGGDVFEIDAFVNIGGEDLNGGTFGTSAQLAVDTLPAGLDLTFSSVLSDANSDITLTYAFENDTGAAITDLTVISFIDAEIDEPNNTLFNELAATSGTLAPGQGFEADEPGFVFGDIFDNALLGVLDDTNVFPPPEDVSMALSFDVASLGVGQSFVVEIMISEDGDLITPGAFSITHTDADPASTTTITYSGAAQVVPEPSSLLLLPTGLLVGAITLRERRRAPTSLAPPRRRGARSR